MPILVLPSSLCEPCSLPREIEAPGATVGQVLAAAARVHPQLGTLLLDEAGRVRRYYSVFKNEEDVRDQGGLEAKVGAGDVVTVLPPIAGGAGPEVRVACQPVREAWLAEAVAHAEGAYPEEACGLVVRAEGGGLEAVRVRNVAADPRRHFEVDPAPVLDALRAGRLHGIYHSHPDGPGEPSAEDVANASPWGGDLEWTIIPVRGGRAGLARSFRPGGAVS